MPVEMAPSIRRKLIRFGTDKALAFVACFVATFIMASASYYFVELPFLRLKDRMAYRVG
jgi:peptidoglycan/LPS O-acetylase OafA/YrhL